MSKQAQINFDGLVDAIRAVDQRLSSYACQAVNISLTLRNFLIGLQIAEFELRGADKAKYGERLLSELAERLASLKISNCNRRQLYDYLNFYRAYPQIARTVSAQLQTFLPEHVKGKIRKAPTLSAQLTIPPDIGQLNTYVSWYRKNMMSKGDNPPVGILLCTQKDHALVEYALAGMDNNIFVSKYQLELPKKDDIQRFLEGQIQAL